MDEVEGDVPSSQARSDLVEVRFVLGFENHRMGARHGRTSFAGSVTALSHGNADRQIATNYYVVVENFGLFSRNALRVAVKRKRSSYHQYGRPLPKRQGSHPWGA